RVRSRYLEVAERERIIKARSIGGRECSVRKVVVEAEERIGDDIDVVAEAGDYEVADAGVHVEVQLAAGERDRIRGAGNPEVVGIPDFEGAIVDDGSASVGIDMRNSDQPVVRCRNPCLMP